MKIYKDCDLLDGEPCAGCTEYTALEAQISGESEVPADTLDLLRQRTQIRTRINQAHDILTTHVPIEIICSIFQFCVPDKSWFYDLDGTGRFPRESQMLSDPLLLGSICRTWRNIAWGIGSLWTVFKVSFTTFQNPNSVLLSREWLDRAGQHPLSIRILTRPGRLPREWAEKAVKLLELINDVSSQWQILDIDGPAWLISRVKGSRGGAPKLETVRIQARDDYSAMFSLLNGTPAPSRLRLDCCRSVDLWHIDWTHLTHLCVIQQYADDAIDMVQRALNLVHCKFDSMLKADFPLPEEPILRPNLESLELSTQSFRSQAQENVQFIKSFIFPNLKHLKIESGGRKNDERNQFSWAPVLSRIFTSSPPLVSLSIRHPGPHTLTEIILPILHRTPLLRELEILVPYKEEYRDAHHEFFQLLTDTSISTDTKVDFLPELRSLTFHGAVEDVAKLWEAIPGTFGPISNLRDPRRRPLKKLVVRTWLKIEGESFSSAFIQSKALVLQFLALRRGGIILDLKATHIATVDVLEGSMKLHDLASDEVNIGTNTTDCICTDE